MSASTVRELFGKESLYTILGVEATATTEQIKRAYFKKALQWHPDKAGDDPAATKRFQTLSFIHSILSDPTKRKSYDRSGNVEDVDDEGDTETAEMWYNYWRTFFPPVTEEAVLTFEKEYRESKEEKADVLRIYEEMEGDMDSILDNVMCSRVEDTDRFVAIIHEGIQTGKVEAYDTFTELYGDGSGDYTDGGEEEEEHTGKNRSSTTTTTKLSSSSSSSSSSSKPQSKASSTKGGGGKQPTRRGLLAAKRAQTARETRAAEEAAEAEEMLAEMRAEYHKQHKSSSSSSSSSSKRSEPSLTELIMARQDNRNRSFANMLTALESKYGGGNIEDNNDDDDDDRRYRKKPSKKKLAIKDQSSPSADSTSLSSTLSTPVRITGTKRNSNNEKKHIDMDVTSPPKGRRKQND